MVSYKKQFAEQYNVPVENIDVKYFIVKRKIPDNPKYPIMKSPIQFMMVTRSLKIQHVI